ncbi:DsrE family protein [Halalkalibacter oceani]|uniref:DsrE family protein n=1 Tax=Halalkalibacter oceani TaxID=1653776 RepID=A0A9X2DQT7_9BACI|nr:DsrE family protein [Halalkalibacter oceani]MCM3715374.1 DsrE family protein [Halalkalibacter oceani]
MSKVCIHLTHGIEAPTQADRAFLIARTAIEEGHQVSMFLAGAAVNLLKDEHLDTILGFGPELRSYYNAIISGGGKIYLSQISCDSRGITSADLDGKEVELSPPNKLVQLSIESDSMITYG